MRTRGITFFLAGAALLAAPILAASHSAPAFKKLQKLAGDWEGKDEKGQPVRTSFKAIVSNTGDGNTVCFWDGGHGDGVQPGR